MNSNLNPAKQSKPIHNKPNLESNHHTKDKPTPNSYFQFYISRYPFLQSSLPQVQLYKTYYDCKGFQLTKDKLAKLTGLNKLQTIVKLKQIVKNVTKNQTLITQIDQNQSFKSIQNHTYSLYYQIVPHFILSPKGLSIINSLIKCTKEYRNIILTPLLQDIQHLINQQIYYLIDLQNIGITSQGQVKLYVPANHILQGSIFTESHSQEMKITANVTIESLLKYLQNGIDSCQNVDIHAIRHDIRKEVFNQVQIKPKTIQSQIFALTQQFEAHQENQIHIDLSNDLEKTVKITTNQDKENQLIKQRMKDYEEKLQSLNNALKQMKDELMIMSCKKDANLQADAPKSIQKNIKQNERPKLYTNLDEINKSRQENICMMVEKLSTSRFQIKKLLHDDTFLKKSYLVEQQDEEEEYEINQIEQALLKEEIGNMISYKNRIETVSHSSNTLQKQKNNIDDQKGQSQQRDQKESSEFQIPEQFNARKSNKKSRASYQYESSHGNNSPPENNPFRQYGNFRIEYVINEQQNQKNQSPQKKQKVNGRIQIHRDPSPRPYKIVTNPPQQRHFFYPMVSIREPFRYSCLAIPKDLGKNYDYIAIPQNIYDPTDYDSVDTFQMELGFGKDYKMPKIVSKNAFRHTLFPSTIIGKRRTDESMRKKFSKGKERIFSRSVKKSRNSHKIHESAESKTFVKYIQPQILKNRNSFSREEVFQNKSNERLTKIQQTLEVQEFSNLKEIHDGVIFQQRDNSKLSLNEDIPIMNIEKGSNNEPNRKIELQKLLSEELSKPEKKPVDKQKLYAVLNKSKQIISRYRMMTHKRNE